MANRYARRTASTSKTPALAGPSRAATPAVRQGTTMQNCPPRQHARGGKLIIAIGGPAPTAIAAGATATITFQIPEEGRLARMVASSSDGNLFGCTLDALEHNNVNLTSGTVPLEMFSDVTVPSSNPYIGRWVLVNDQVSATITNNTAGALEFTLAFSVA